MASYSFTPSYIGIADFLHFISSAWHISNNKKRSRNSEEYDDIEFSSGLAVNQYKRRVVAKIKKYEGCNKWSEAEIITDHDALQNCIKINLRRGDGCLKIYPNIIQNRHCEIVKEELLQSDLFRRYKLQGNFEPRLHFLLHENATKVFSHTQPGYHYSTVKMKARPLSVLPKVQKLSKYVANICKIKNNEWTIGVNPIIYRSGNDRMGDHADDDQGEKVILALVVNTPSNNIHFGKSHGVSRRTVIRPFKRLKLEKGDEYIELFLGKGDAYEMNGEMQNYYSHSVPPNKNRTSVSHGDNNTTSEASLDQSRIVIVFRVGDCVMFKDDNGTPYKDLRPQKKPPLQFGNMQTLIEGYVYSRHELISMGAHIGQQKGLSGNRNEGCNAIIVSGLREDRLGEDNFKVLAYAVERRKGALGVVTSFKDNKCIRIFRSTSYKETNIFGATIPQKNPNSKKSMYRYDGLYKVTHYQQPEDQLKEPFKFRLERFDCDNTLTCIDLLNRCIELETIRDERVYFLFFLLCINV